MRGRCFFAQCAYYNIKIHKKQWLFAKIFIFIKKINNNLKV